MTTSVILPIYILNKAMMDMTEQFLLSMNEEKPTELIIVDDGSHLPFGKGYFTDFFDTRIFRLDPNQGYTKAVNEGLKSAKGDVLIVANNDLTLDKGWLSGLLKPLEEGFDISTVQVVDRGQAYQIRDEITEGDKFGSLWAVKRSVYKKLGGLDEELGSGYFTDLDYQKRSEQAGFKAGKNWRTVVYHMPKSTFSEVDPTDEQYLAAYAAFKKKHGKVW
jgi:GT2 family glycosyltransferase